jgi:xanthine dehydrogenase accessory factor
MGYSVEGAPIVARGGALFAVVATMGEDDEGSVAAALAARPAYVAVVASRKRFAELREALLARGIRAAEIDAVHNPAGLDIGARTPEEVALSIFAEMVQLRHAKTEHEHEPEHEKMQTDPVCGMSVDPLSAKPRAEHAGRTWYFCNPRCREKFLAEPGRFLAA